MAFIESTGYENRVILPSPTLEVTAAKVVLWNVLKMYSMNVFYQALTEGREAAAVHSNNGEIFVSTLNWLLKVLQLMSTWISVQLTRGSSICSQVSDILTENPLPTYMWVVFSSEALIVYLKV